jgi:hypothetical protein
VGVGSERLEVVFNKLELTGLVQGCWDSMVKKVVVLKGKEKLGVEGWDPKPTGRFKPKRKKVFKSKVGVGLGSGPNGVKPSLSLQRLMT